MDRMGRRASDRGLDGSISKLLRVGLYEHKKHSCYNYCRIGFIFPVLIGRYLLAVEEINYYYYYYINEELSDLHSPNIVRVIKSRRMRWAGHIARKGERKGVYRVLVGKPGYNSPFGRPGVDGRIILRWFFRKWDVGVWTGSSWLRVRTGGRHL